MIKYVGYVVKPDIVEDLFIISIDIDNVNKRSRRGKTIYIIESKDIINSLVYYSYNSDTKEYINNNFYMETYKHEIFDTFKDAQKDVLKTILE